MNAEYWTERYTTDRTGWDVGYATPPITVYFDALDDKSQRILIPGAGNAYEASYLHTSGFESVTICDISNRPLQNFVKTNPTFPKNRIIHGDFFALEGSYDIIVEQTFFCALSPALRTKYVKKVHQLLNKDGYLVGVLFDRHFSEGGPPFGGSVDEYIQLFSPYFQINKMEQCYNSVLPRQGTEVFIKMYKL